MNKYKNVVEDVKGSNGKVIKYLDVCKVLSTGELVVVGFGRNEHHKTEGLSARNKHIGLSDWLDVYPDGELEVLGNLGYVNTEVG